MVREIENSIPLLRKVISDQIGEAIVTSHRNDFLREIQVHELRKNIKRIRSLVRLLKANLTEQEFHKLNEHIGELGRMLTLQRESTVNLNTFLHFGTSIEAEITASGKEKIINLLTNAVHEAYSDKDSQYHKTIMGLSFQLSKLKDWIELMPLREFSCEIVNSSIKGTLNKTVRLFSDSRCSKQAEILHKWRRFNKHLYFQIRFSKLLPKQGNQEFLKKLNDLNEILGQEHDLFVLEGYLQDKLHGILPVQEIANIKTFIDHKRYFLEKEAFSLGKSIYSNHSITFFSNKKIIPAEYNIIKHKKLDLSPKI